MNKRNIVIVVCVLVVLALSGVVWYGKNAKREPVLDSQQPSQMVTEDDNSLQTQPNLYPQHIVAIPGSDQVWYEIPELGVRMKLNKEFAGDLIYKQLEDSFSVVLSLKSVTALNEECAPKSNGTGGLFGALFKVKGNAKEEAKTDKYLAARVNEYVQISEYYYGLSEAQAVCWNQNQEADVRKVFPGSYDGSGAKSISDGIKTLQLTPEGK